MGGCCCCASKATGLTSSPPFLHYPHSEEREPLSSHQATVSVLSTGLLVDTNLDTSVPDTYRPPPAPLPYETYVGRSSTTPSGNRGSPLNKSEVSSQTTSQEPVEYTSGGTPESKVKNVECDERGEANNEMAVSKEMEGEDSDDDLKKSTAPIVTPLPDEEDCPICLEEYDMENPKLITKCDHHFHLACILEWMERSDSCPVCDQEMVLSPAMGG